LLYPVAFSELAIDALAGISLWIAARADKDVAHAYVERLKAFALRIGGYPRGGTPRNEFAPGLRSVTFERRDVIVCHVANEVVEILRIVSNFRDLRAVFA
jgi:toxin ParE1/3/4